MFIEYMFKELQITKSSNPVFAIITDFGFDYSIASMKALILREFLGAQIVDIDHSIKQFSVLSGAFVINKVYEYFPDQTIFICVIDPGVGTKREPIIIDTGRYKFVGPNNGLFHYIIKELSSSCKTYEIKEEFRPVKSTTFHGRDLFTPAAIEIAKGNFDIVKPIERDKLVLIPVLDSGLPVITYIDGFGNIKTNISLSNHFNEKDFLKVNINDTTHSIKISKMFSEVASGELLCYRGSNDTLEIAANLASAGDILRVNVGDSITITE
ncbi:MAG: SAM-dependent chlorinase/fluorinase [Candidatus Taylorbacteria bacterium]|nr:SAM-dependent chlorinase/fluorinase [Candidatus Taylorbacteria bacterium]